MIHYGEAHELYRAFIGDGMDVKRDDDIPMGAMWAPGSPFISQAQGDADLRESAPWRTSTVKTSSRRSR